MPDTLASSRSSYYPTTIVKNSEGNVLIGNGLDRIQRWNGVLSSSRNAGVDAPSAAPSVSAASGGGASAGSYVLYFRYVDEDGHYSDLSPVRTLTMTAGQKFSWTSVPDSSDPKVMQKELWRSTAGQATEIYRVTTIAQGVTTYSDTTDDDTLEANGTEMPILLPDGTPNANRFGVPPSHKLAMVHYAGRMWYAADAEYSEGCVQVTNGSAVVTGIGTAFTALMQTGPAGAWNLTIAGDNQSYTVSTVDSATQITLTANYAGTTSKFAIYTIRPPISEDNLIYFSEADEPESVPSSNAYRMIEDGDKITGLIGLYDSIYITKRRSIYRLRSGCCDPTAGVKIYRVSARGCVNHRAFVLAQDACYLLDRAGVWRLGGNAAELGGDDSDISQPIADVIRRINWSQERWFHAEHDPQNQIIKFFVCVTGSRYPRQALCYNYQWQSWHTEDAPDMSGGATVIQTPQGQKIISGGEHARHWMHEGSVMDGDPSGDVYATADSATQTSLTDSGSLRTLSAGSVIAIVAGRGKGQKRRIVSDTSGRIDIKTPWLIKPDSTSVYQIGGVEWRYKSGRYRLAKIPRNNNRSVRLMFVPTEGEASLDIRLWMDHKQLPENNGSSSESTLVTCTRNDPDAVVNLKRLQSYPADDPAESPGYAEFEFDGQQRRQGPANRTVAVELRGFQGQYPVAIECIELEGAGG